MTTTAYKIQPNIRQRLDAIAMAKRVLRAENPTEFAAKKRLNGDSLPMIYISQLLEAGRYLPAHELCDASIERCADQKISKKYGWQTIDQLRDECTDALRIKLTDG